MNRPTLRGQFSDPGLFLFMPARMRRERQCRTIAGASLIAWIFSMPGDPKFTAQAFFVMLVVGACVWMVGTLFGAVGWFLGAGIGLAAFYAVIFTIADQEDRRRDKGNRAAGALSSNQQAPPKQ